MKKYVIYVQFNSDYNGNTGYVRSWETGYYPSLTDDEYEALKFPSQDAAVSFAKRMQRHFTNQYSKKCSLKYWEVVQL